MGEGEKRRGQTQISRSLLPSSALREGSQELGRQVGGPPWALCRVSDPVLDTAPIIPSVSPTTLGDTTSSWPHRLLGQGSTSWAACFFFFHLPLSTLRIHAKLSGPSSEVPTILATWHFLYESFSSLSEGNQDFFQSPTVYSVSAKCSVTQNIKIQSNFPAAFSDPEKPETSWFPICMLFL